MKVMIDTSIVIDHLRTFSKTKKSHFYTLYQECDEILFSTITVGEVFSGQSASLYEKEIADIFALGTIIGSDTSLMKDAGKIRRETHISLLDAIIAATALRFDVPIATLNTKDFEQVAGLTLHTLASGG